MLSVASPSANFATLCAFVAAVDSATRFCGFTSASGAAFLLITFPTCPIIPFAIARHVLSKLTLSCISSFFLLASNSIK